MFVVKAKREIKRMNTVINNLEQEELGELHAKIIPERRMLINPYILSDEEYVNYWLNVEYKGKSFEDDSIIIMTERGERVRSKSEKIIADKLYSMGIPYRYEYPLKLKSFGVVYPDFTILDISTRSEKYIEHFGMMDDPEYANKAICKIDTYEKNGIYIGEKLLATFETSKKIVDMNVFEMKIKQLL